MYRVYRHNPVLTANECWQKYPKHKFPDNITQGASRKRARDACIAASIQGKEDPELRDGPAILKDYVALWRSPYPWTERPADKTGNALRIIGRVFDPTGTITPKSGGDVLRSVAVGWRPPMGVGQDRFKELEQKATILGAVDVLKAAGIQPWVSVNVPDIELKLRNDKTDAALVNFISNVLKSAGSQSNQQIKNLTQASEYMRQLVSHHQLDAAAWTARSVYLSLPASVAQKKRQTALSAAGAALSTAGMLLNSTFIGAIVGVPLTAAGLTLTASAGQTKLEKMRADNLTESMQAETERQLQLRGLNQQKQELQAQINKAISEMSDTSADSLLGEAIARNVKIGVWVGTLSISTILIYTLASQYLDKQHTKH